jgi:hypothetical protein
MLPGMKQRIDTTPPPYGHEITLVRKSGCPHGDDDLEVRLQGLRQARRGGTA